MIEIVLVLAATFGGGWYVGHQNPSVSCVVAAQVKENCVDVEPPIDASFGATTTKLVELIGTYKRCKAACEASK